MPQKVEISVRWNTIVTSSPQDFTSDAEFRNLAPWVVAVVFFKLLITDIYLS